MQFVLTLLEMFFTSNPMKAAVVRNIYYQLQTNGL